MNCLIVGGTSGLGLNLAQKLSADYSVIITGRHDPHQDGIEFRQLELSQDGLPTRIKSLVKRLPPIDLLIYAPGFSQEKAITDLSEHEIQDMLNVCLTGCIHLTRELLLKQGKLGGFIVITSTSQWTPRPLEAVYTAAKAGIAMYANSLSLDERVIKTLVAGPGGMATPFWNGTGKDTSGMLSEDWVADQILALFADKFSYRFMQLTNKPDRPKLVTVVETR